jgi:hypothetical protein
MFAKVLTAAVRFEQFKLGVKLVQIGNDRSFSKCLNEG